MSCDGQTHKSFCNLETCDITAWKSEAGGIPCEDQIHWVQTNIDSSEAAACHAVSSEFLSSECGLACNPITTQPDLYCFPAPDIHSNFEGVWGDYLVENKDSSFLSVCGPGNNKFTSNTVSLSNNSKLTMQFKNVDGMWEGAFGAHGWDSV
jgi:hypothetical protein